MAAKKKKDKLSKAEKKVIKDFLKANGVKAADVEALAPDVDDTLDVEQVIGLINAELRKAKKKAKP
jgi:hypothetical protein